MVCKINKSVIIFWLVSFFIFSCQTMPRIPDAFREDAVNAPLNTGANVYFFANAKEARSIINLLPIQELRDRQTRQMLDRTDYLAAALFPPTSGRRFQLVTWGNYPRSYANMAFSADNNWQSQQSASGHAYWHSSANRLSLAITSKQAFAASSLRNQPLDPFAAEPGVKIPDGFNSFRRNAPLSCWLNNSGLIIERILNDAGIPIRLPVREIFFNLEPSGGNYQLTARFQFDNASQARGMVALLVLAGNNIPNNQLLALLFSNQPILDGSNVDIKPAPLTESELQSFLDFLLGGFR